jgi:hypothetical protein
MILCLNWKSLLWFMPKWVFSSVIFLFNAFKLFTFVLYRVYRPFGWLLALWSFGSRWLITTWFHLKRVPFSPFVSTMIALVLRVPPTILNFNHKFVVQISVKGERINGDAFSNWKGDRDIYSKPDCDIVTIKIGRLERLQGWKLTRNLTSPLSRSLK